MGYQAEKIKVEGKMRIVKIIVLCVLLAALLGLCIFSAFVSSEEWKYHVGKPDVAKRHKGEMRIHFLDVGQGDATLVELPDGKVALIDGGNERESTKTTILRYLNALEIDTIDYLIVTHADGDHCGSLEGVLKYKKVLNAYLPAVDPEKAGKEYAEFYAALLNENCTMQYSCRSISLGNEESKTPYVFSFLYPYTIDVSEDATKNDSAANDNGSSSVLWLDYMEKSVLFMGDAPFATEEILMRDDGMGLFDRRGVELDSTEILKVAHHGGASSTSLAFLQYLHVETAVISCGKNNLYGHPSDEVKENLAAVNASTYRTDELGTVIVTVKETGEYKVSNVD